MMSDNGKIIAVLVVIAALLVGGYGGLVMSTGLTSPFSSVMSESMQHDDTRSSIGCIDTGDTVIVALPEKTEIQSYIEGSHSGFSTFGDYGSVVIYEHWSNKNPVIHRAIVWLDYNPATDTWSAPSLKNYEGEWHDSSFDKDCMDLHGTLVFSDITQSHKNVSFNLDSLQNKASGFLTLGDNPVTNNSFDQSSPGSYLVSMDKINSVAIHELPWIASLKILLKNDGDNLEKVPNSIPSLFMALILLVAVLIILDLFSVRKNTNEIEEELKKMEKL